MTLDAWLTLAITAAAVLVMAKEWLEPAIALSLAVGILILAGVLEPARALNSFSSDAVAVVGLLLVLGTALERTPWLPWFADRMLGSTRGPRSLARSLPIVCFFSAFLSNTAVVAVLAPAARRWALRHREAPSKLLMPISFAALLGGVLTLIGTSTNLVVHGLLLANGQPGLSLFSTTAGGLLMALVGLTYLITSGYNLLPRYADPIENATFNPREYVARLEVQPASPLIGKKVADLRHLENIFLSGIEREAQLLAPVGPEEIFRSLDVLQFVGRVDSLAGVASLPGLHSRHESEGDGRLQTRGRLVEAVISPSSPIVGLSFREARFRTRYGAVVLAVHRHGERIDAKIGDIVAHPGDTLLLQVSSDFLARFQYCNDFYLVSEAGQVPDPAAPTGAWLEPLVLFGVVAISAFEWLSLLKAGILGLLVLFATRRLRPAQLWSDLDWPVLVMIGASGALGNALIDSGAAKVLAALLLSAVGDLGPTLLIAVIFGLTAVLTEFVTNVAAATLVFPVALAAAERTGVPIAALSLAVVFGASSSFLTPMGYQTNAMVAGIAGYRLSDFVRVGLPLKLLTMAAAVVALRFF